MLHLFFFGSGCLRRANNYSVQHRRRQFNGTDISRGRGAGVLTPPPPPIRTRYTSPSPLEHIFQKWGIFKISFELFSSLFGIKKILAYLHRQRNMENLERQEKQSCK